MAVARTRIPKKPEEEIGKEIELLGKDWRMGGNFTARAFKCFVTRYDAHKDWKKRQIPQVRPLLQAFALLCLMLAWL